MLYAERLLHRKMVGAPGTDGRRRLGTQHEALRQLFVAILVTESAVIDSRDVQLGRETVGKHAVDLVHATCDRTRRVLPVADGLEESRRLVTIGSALGRNLIADAPHDYGRRIPERMEHAYHVTLGPLVEITVITILAFGIVPLVERLHHHHETHFVTKAYKLGSRRIVRRPDRIATHVLQHCQLMPQCRYAHGRAERTEVMMIADTLELPVLAVQIKALLRDELDRTDAETRLIFIRHNPVHQDAGQCLIEVRVLR